MKNVHASAPELCAVNGPVEPGSTPAGYCTVSRLLTPSPRSEMFEKWQTVNVGARCIVSRTQHTITTLPKDALAQTPRACGHLHAVTAALQRQSITQSSQCELRGTYA